MLVMTPAPCRPIQIVKDVAEMIVAPERDVEYALDITSRYNELVDWVNVDPQRVAQTVMNLVNNAIKFTRNRPVRRITIRLDASLSKPPVDVGDFVDEDGVRSTPKELSGESSVIIICSVQDTGIGIEPDEAKKLFRRFQ
jgi:signal transduction histidine kinase